MGDGLDSWTLQKIYERAALCRAFEAECYLRIAAGDVKFPVYLSAGQEYIPVTLSVLLEQRGLKTNDRQIFIQHRGHSTYLSFGGSMDALVRELLGRKDGCSYGMGGSASIQSEAANIFGHDGLMGSHAPIAAGAAFANRKFTLCFIGDAAAEEDYFLATLGWAVTENLPIWFIVEDNDLAILTKKRVRRSWEISNVAFGFRMRTHDVTDAPENLEAAFYPGNGPRLVNVHTTRRYWHAGAGQDEANPFDRHAVVAKDFSSDYVESVQEFSRRTVQETWTRAFEK